MARPKLDQFRQDAHGNLQGGFRADGQADRAAHPLQVGGAEALRPQAGMEGIPFAVTTDHADVTRRRAQGLSQDAPIARVILGEDHQQAVTVEGPAGQGLVIGGQGQDLLDRRGKALPPGEGGPVIQDPDLEVGLACQ